MLPDLLEFMIWGDLAIMKAAGPVPDEAYYQERGVSHGSLHKLLVHAMGAQWVWLNRFWEKRVAMPTAEEYPTREALAARWAEVHEALREFLRGQTPESLEKPLSFTNFRGDRYTHTVGELFLHVTDHGTYHRGQQNTLIKMCGGMPVNVFYYLWSLSQSGGR
jgi:uncharacterized damage-inducible protein DinB